MSAPAPQLANVYRLDVTRQELAYLILQADIGARAANARVEGDNERLAQCAKELADAAQIFSADCGPGAIKQLLDRMAKLAGIP